ncbi:hypothetical protein BJY01DRAFT_259970 [Aspergillus pseudoustus]|uniref:DUF4246 domain-containing protein n=1 Tax=Aspergillus pseudoustus TaxID=1810923 RepID=A0ABR4KJG8_9EURO
MSLHFAPAGLPGYSLPLDYEPTYDIFPNALSPRHIEDGYFGMTVGDSVSTSIDPYFGQVFDDEITTKWRKEVANGKQDITPKMMDWILEELRWKAGYLAKHRAIMVFDTGVVVSDMAIATELQQELRDAVGALEMKSKKDFHPGSEDKVVDLVHPSLLPVIYGRSRILTNRLMDLDNCLNYVGEDQLIPIPPKPSSLAWYSPFSRKFQCMPCDIEFPGDSGCRIVSYINTLHPKKNRPLYEVLEKIVAQTIPLWDITLSNVKNDKLRIDPGRVSYDPSSPGSTSWSDWEENRDIVQPEPGDFDPKKVIVKLSNIELTPEKPEYHGGTWHVEGALNEHICATAIYYYDSKNITESSLAFRQRIFYDDVFDFLDYEQNYHEFLQRIFGMAQDVESRGRLLTFPNMLQHCVSPFGLADTSKPGHRKILALFLSEEWWEEKRDAIFIVLPKRLPRELQDMVMENVDVGHITMNEACQYRLELMEERTAKTAEANKDFEIGDFNLCEH